AFNVVRGRIEVEAAVGNEPRFHGMHLNRNRLSRWIVCFRFSSSRDRRAAATPNTCKEAREASALHSYRNLRVAVSERAGRGDGRWRNPRDWVAISQPLGL